MQIGQANTSSDIYQSRLQAIIDAGPVKMPQKSQEQLIERLYDTVETIERSRTADVKATSRSLELFQNKLKLANEALVNLSSSATAEEKQGLKNQISTATKTINSYQERLSYLNNHRGDNNVALDATFKFLSLLPQNPVSH